MLNTWMIFHFIMHNGLLQKSKKKRKKKETSSHDLGKEILETKRVMIR